ncbi:Bcr/CflA family efflux MFS transporter [Microbacterium azadirachtae]|uniref:Bcr/CflA family efflux MFS transporter n=1 Tax=Microbacterium azadirachtae TaxID=582680 RepID=UPI00088D641A|nr:Bcr/CflA family efflux MFS transporter [Microbacterium azadirachtae]UXW85449.1 Bcr/CflA family efflux MFS transporter [Microbacterium azadirachtae]SDM15856.1 MFS transporter, DHA1 family, bicyclomycin/chloramphenicol resistance protein [Microbacterium azadirachtae]SEG39295.1 MFS transporter, DHA1 family, bicyclomycin/chloramphenicol resistance protein [Microbacterium azadirachtae]SEG42332.1 MFS transporter, DHA1 family, bicyclomycin/chloramphenicol resistance protein [Microbacterium azadirac
MSADGGLDDMRARRSLLPALGALSAFGPLSIDLYIPALPQLGRDLLTTEALTQVTMSACLIGIAVGQLLWGPVSDRYGRRRPLLWAVAAFALCSFLCAAAPSIELLILVRLLQGLCGAAGLAIGRAVVHDVFHGAEATAAFAALTAIAGAAPVLAPLIGGGLLAFTDWRGLFLALGAIGLALLLTAALCVPETLATAQRTTGGLGSDLRGLGAALSNAPFMVFAITLGLATGGFFTYLQMSSFVLQREYGVGAQGFAVIFAVNAGGIMLGAWISRRVARGSSRSAPDGAHAGIARRRRDSGRRLVLWSLSLGTVAAAAVLLSALLHSPLPWLLPPLFLLVSLHGVNNPTLTALALSRITRGAGSASAVLGTLAALLGALVPPLLSQAGVSATLMGATMLVAFAAALTVLALTGRVTRTGE